MALLYGRMYLPASTLEALYLRRLSPTKQLRVTAVSDPKLKHGGTVRNQHPGVIHIVRMLLIERKAIFEMVVYIDHGNAPT